MLTLGVWVGEWMGRWMVVSETRLEGLLSSFKTLYKKKIVHHTFVGVVTLSLSQGNIQTKRNYFYAFSVSMFMCYNLKWFFLSTSDRSVIFSLHHISHIIYRTKTFSLIFFCLKTKRALDRLIHEEMKQTLLFTLKALYKKRWIVFADVYDPDYI